MWYFNTWIYIHVSVKPLIFTAANGTEGGVAPPVIEDSGAADTAAEGEVDQPQEDEEPEPPEFTPNVVCTVNRVCFNLP